LCFYYFTLAQIWAGVFHLDLQLKALVFLFVFQAIRVFYAPYKKGKSGTNIFSFLKRL
jgi:hypothetical protein